MGQSLSFLPFNNDVARDDLNSSGTRAGNEDMPLEDVQDSTQGLLVAPSAKPNETASAQRGDSSSRPMSEAPLSSSALSTDEGFLTPMSITQNHDRSVAEPNEMVDASNPLPSVTPLASVPASTLDRMAEISDRVSKILAPVHALGSFDQDQSQINLDQQLGVPSPSVTVENQVGAGSGVMTPTTPTIVARNGGRRGRGIRRRGGSPLGSDTITVISTTQSDFVTPNSRGRGSRGGRPRGSRGGRGGSRGGKRKRPDEGGNNDSDSSENFTPLVQSRSGRKIVHALTSAPVIKIEDDTPTVSPSSQPVKVTPIINKTITFRGSGKKRGSSKRTPGGPGAICKNCGRSPSLEGNRIVFCDGCNTPWHKYCHDPPIPDDVILTAEKEWFCSDCVVLKEEKSRLQGKVSGQQMSLLEKRRYLQTLPPRELVSLLLHACSLHPDLPIFNPAINGDTAGEMEDYYEDEDLLRYPKPGNGLPLGNKDDLRLMVDDDTKVFSHITTGIAEMVMEAKAKMAEKARAKAAMAA